MNINMSETKTCPFCGKEILADAKKCKHCGEFLEKKCPVCGEWINVKAMKCKHCGSWLNKFAKADYEKSVTTTTVSDSESEKPDGNDIVASVLMFFENIIIVLLLGYLLDWQWWVEMLVIFGVSIIMSIRIIRILYCILISLVWALIGLALSPWISGDSDWDMLMRVANEDYGDYWWIAAIAGIVSLVLHAPAMKSGFKM